MVKDDKSCKKTKKFDKAWCQPRSTDIHSTNGHTFIIFAIILSQIWPSLSQVNTPTRFSLLFLNLYNPTDSWLLKVRPTQKLIPFIPRQVLSYSTKQT